MTDIAKAQHPLARRPLRHRRPEVVEAQVSTDGTRKWLLRSDDGQDFEMVFIPDADRGTLCVSSQVGCTLNCRFCHTGTMRLVRNLTPGEIVGQVMLARDAALGEWPSRARMAGMLTNIVMMGMGEPLYNFDNVRDALKIVMDGDGLRAVQAAHHAVDLGRRADDGTLRRGDRRQPRGVAARRDQGGARRDRADQPQVRHRGTAAGLRRLSRRSNNARRITFEYVMLKDKNDSDADARELVRLLRKYKLPAKVNLIPFNPWPGAPMNVPIRNRIARFSDIVFEAGISAGPHAARARHRCRLRPGTCAGRRPSSGSAGPLPCTRARV
jgi:23S rRNA (adenine2503-C2)-methyltransferase